jgi:16S rRNA (cytidine1402-2'-O)-methyltransferase
MQKASLYLIPSPLGKNDHFDQVFPAYNLEVIRSLEYFIAENLRTARRFISAVGHPIPIDRLTFFELGKHSLPEDLNTYLDPLHSGKSIGLLSEAGTPCIADPGAGIVALAQQMKVAVLPLIGPNSILMALMASGFNGQQFTFHGYLPVDRKELIHKLKTLETEAEKKDQTQIFIETPFRNEKLLDAILKSCKPETKLCIAVNLTLQEESILTDTIANWKQVKTDLHKKPAVFLLYRG